MRSLLTGATGDIGGSILSSLVSKGHHVTCPVRSLAKASSLKSKYGDRIALIELDQSLTQYERFKSVAKGFENIIHSGFVQSSADNDLETEVTSGLLEAAKETSLGSKSTFILTTGSLLIGSTSKLLGDEEATVENCSDYVKFRIPHEELVIKAGTDRLHTSVIRPAAIYPGSHVEQYFRACKKNGKIVIPEGNHSLSYIHKEDLGELYRLVLENSGTGYFIGSEGLGPNTEEVISLAKRITGVTEVERIQNPWQYFGEYGFYLVELGINLTIDSTKARKLYGFAPKHNIARDLPNLIKL